MSKSSSNGSSVSSLDESCVTGWYHSPGIIGPNPKPICTDATLYSFAVTHNA